MTEPTIHRDDLAEAVDQTESKAWLTIQVPRSRIVEHMLDVIADVPDRVTVGQLRAVLKSLDL